MATTQTHWHALDAQETLERVKSRAAGLHNDDIPARRAKAGPNELPRQRVPGWWVFVVRQLESPLILVLLAAAAVSLWLGDAVDAGVIGVAVLLNAVVGFVQEYKASRALEHLRGYVQPECLVRRDGTERLMSARELVPGDVLVVRAGDHVAADARLLSASELEVNEASLTGESMPVRKDVAALAAGTPLSERQNLLYAGTSVVAGRGEAVVVATGLHTELGRVAQLVSETQETRTPLQEQLFVLARSISAMILCVVAAIFLLGVLSGRGWLEMFQTSVALAVAAIPEGLSIAVTVILAVGMQRILARKALTRRLLAAETLGSVSVICTDKTGTITEGQMRVDRIVLPSGDVNSFTIERPKVAEEVMKILEACVMCNDASVSEGTGLSKLEIVGSPTEHALLDAATSVGLSIASLRHRYPRLAEVPFDSSRKFMVTLHRVDGGRAAILKGAPERVLERCDATAGERERLEKIAGGMAEDGLRVIAVARKRVPDARGLETAEDGFAFMGFVALRDPLRRETAEQIRAARDAGIRTVLVTGDHPKTARAIAREAGLVVERDGVVTGAELDAWDDAQLEKRITSVAVFARVEPRHKIRIVRAWQARGKVVAMTGDGVNDAPALKAADVGVALGSGTDVAKEVADLVLLDNNLGTITAAIEQGRVIFDNIRKSIAYLMSSGFTEIVLIAGAILLSLPLPLTAAQILWINLVADTFPNLALTIEPGEPDVMRQKPRPRDERVLNRDMIKLVFLVGIITDCVLFALYVWLLSGSTDPTDVRSFMFAALGVYSVIYVFALRSFRRTMFATNPFSNPWLVLGVGAGLALMFAAFAIVPLRDLLELTPIPLSSWSLLLMIGLLKLIAIEAAKAVIFRRSRSNASV